MSKHFFPVIFCLFLGAAAFAGNPSMSAHELAEARLLAEWVGSPDQQHVLGTAYYEGDGVPRDYTEALKWYQKAAEQGYADSQYMLAEMYDSGQGVKRDDFTAVGWYRKAAEQGITNAQFKLAGKYAEGKGFPQNYLEAYLWYSISAANGMEKAASKRDSYAKKLSRDELSEAQKRSAAIFENIQKKKQGQS